MTHGVVFCAFFLIFFNFAKPLTSLFLFLLLQVSAMQCGVLSLCPESITMGDVSYYSEYSGVLDDQEMKDKLARALGPNNKVGSSCFYTSPF